MGIGKTVCLGRTQLLLFIFLQVADADFCQKKRDKQDRTYSVVCPVWQLHSLKDIGPDRKPAP